MTFAIILSVAFPLFLIMDPVGNMPIFLALLKNKSNKQQRQIMMRELLFALIFIVGFYFVGNIVLGYLKIEASTIRIAGGIILFLLSIKMIFPQIEKNNADLVDQDPYIVPIAIPLISGPTLIAAVSLYSHQINNHIVLLLAILLAWLANVVIYMFMPFLKAALKERGLKACERLMGLLLMLMSVQMLLDGIRLYIGELN